MSICSSNLDVHSEIYIYIYIYINKILVRNTSCLEQERTSATSITYWKDLTARNITRWSRNDRKGEWPFALMKCLDIEEH